MKRIALGLGILLTCLPIHAKENIDAKAQLEFLKSKILENPTNFDLRIQLVEQYLELGALQAALNELDKVKQSGASINTWGLTAAKLYLATGRFEDAILAIDEVDESVKNQDYFLVLGDAYLAAGQTDLAKRTYEKIATDSIEKQLGLARTYFIKKDLETAHNHVKQAKNLAKKTINPSLDSKIHTIQAEIYREQKAFQKAKLHYQEALTLNSNNFLAHLQYVSLLLGLEEKEEFNKEALEIYKKSPRHPRVLYYAAIAYLEQKNIDATLKLLNESINQFPNFEESYLLLGRVLFEQKKYLLAEQNVKAFLKFRPNHSLATKLLAAVEIKLNRAKAAIELLQPFEEQLKDDPNFLVLYGTALLLNHEIDKAQELLEKAQSLGMENPIIETELAISHLRQGDIQEGQELLQKIADSNDKVIQADVLLVLSLVESKQYSKALSVAQNIVKKVPDHPAAYNLLGMIYESAKNYDLAKQNYQLALTKDPNFVLSQNNLTELYILNQNYQDAKKNIKLTLKNNPNNLRAQLLMAHLNEKLGQHKEVIKWFEKAKSSHMKSFEPRAQLISYYMRKGEIKKANFEANNLYNQFPRSKMVLSLVGRMKVAQGKYAEAYKIFEDWRAIEKENPYVSYMLAKVAFSLGKMKDSEVYNQQALKLNEKYIPALTLKLQLLLKNKKLDEALNIAKKIHEIVPEADFANQLMGKVYLLKQDKKQSFEYLKKAYDIKPSFENVTSLFQGYILNQNLKQGIEVLENWAEQHANHIGIRRYIAMQSLNNQLYDKAIHYYEQVVEKSPADYITFNNLAVLYLQKDIDKAYKYAKKAYQLAADKAKVVDTLGWVLFNKKQPEKALPLLEQAHDLSPNQLDIQYHLAATLYQLGSTQQAQKLLKDILKPSTKFDEKGEAQNLLNQINTETK